MFWTFVGAILFVLLGLPIIIAIVAKIIGASIEYAPFIWRWFFAAIIGFILFVIYSIVVHANFSETSSWEILILLALFYSFGYAITTKAVPSSKQLKNSSKTPYNHSQSAKQSTNKTKAPYDNVAEAVVLDEKGRRMKQRTPHFTDETSLPRWFGILFQALLILVGVGVIAFVAFVLFA